MVRENMRALLKVQTLTPGSFPIYPFCTFFTACSWNLMSQTCVLIRDYLSYTYDITMSPTLSFHCFGLRTLYWFVTSQMWWV